MEPRTFRSGETARRPCHTIRARDYARHLEARRASLVEAIRQHVMFGNLRGGVFVAGLAAAYASFARHLFPGWWLLGFMAAFYWAGAQLERAINARARVGRAILFYERALARLDGRWSGTGGETGDRFQDDEHYARGSRPVRTRFALRIVELSAHANRRGHARRVVESAG
jgi:hypothetical protein